MSDSIKEAVANTRESRHTGVSIPETATHIVSDEGQLYWNAAVVAGWISQMVSNRTQRLIAQTVEVMNGDEDGSKTMEATQTLGACEGLRDAAETFKAVSRDLLADAGHPVPDAPVAPSQPDEPEDDEPVGNYL